MRLLMVLFILILVCGTILANDAEQLTDEQTKEILVRVNDTIAEFNKMDDMGNEDFLPKLLEQIEKDFTILIEGKKIAEAKILVNQLNFSKKTQKEFEERLQEEIVINRIIVTAKSSSGAALQVIEKILKQFGRIDDAVEIWETIDKENLPNNLKSKAGEIGLFMDAISKESPDINDLETIGDYFSDSQVAKVLHRSIVAYEAALEKNPEIADRARLVRKLADVQKLHDSKFTVIEIDIPAKEVWTKVITVSRGMVLHITADGTWNTSKRKPVARADSVKFGLRLKVGNESPMLYRQLIENKYIVEKDGVLFMGMNDDKFSDNFGSLKVKITILKR